MKLSPGFVVGGRYRIEELIASGSKFRVYSATTDEDGPGQVAVKVARHDDVQSLGGLEAGRARVQAEWDALVRLHEKATSAAPLPLELVRMYPGDPDVRRVALLDKRVVRQEPYLVCELTDGTPLSGLLQGESMDEERALLIALRTVLVVRAAREVGVEIEDFSPSNFVVDHAGENVSVVGLTSGRPLAPARPNPGRDAVPPGYGRLLASLLAGIAAPDWGSEPEDLPRWRKLLANRRVPPEFHSLILGALGFRDEFPPGLDAVENRIRALVRAPRPKVYDHPGRKHDAPYLIANGETIADRFTVVKPLGQGGRGFVYIARDSVSEAEVLFKCNKYVYDSGSAFALELPTRRMELEHEFDVLKKFAAKTGMLPQPVAMVRGRGRGAWFDLAPDLARGEPFVVMEWIKGIPLLDLLPHPYLGYEGALDPNNRLPPRLVLRLVAQIADLIGRFHEDGFLYQDLKPENVLYDAKAENVYMVDFAGACPRQPDGALDKQHVAFGVQTHGFAAPEFAELWERCDDRFDIYSLGATAYHLLTGINPERVALEEGTEYPTLSRVPLQTLPPPVAELVDRMLAPPDQRLPDAASVMRVAEAARLQLSRARPLDVRNASVRYTAQGVELRWKLPPDPRVDRMRIRRFVGEESAAEVVFEGPASERWVDPAPAGVDCSYVVDTGYERSGRVKHSRGRVLEAEAHPAPVVFEVGPDFGGNRVRCELAPHATDLRLRYSVDGPPMTIDEGEELDVDEGRTALHLVGEGVTVHYAAFAMYGAAASAPRFATATALGALPEPGALLAEQRQDGVLMSWDAADPAWVVEAVEQGRVVRRLVPEPGRSSALDAQVLPERRVTYRLVGVEAGVRSDPRAEVEVHRWPALPPVSVTPGPARVTLDTSAPVHARFTGFEVGVGAEPGAEPAWQPFEGFPFTTAVPPSVETVVAVRARVDGGETGPGVAARVTAPPSEVVVDLSHGEGLLPLLIFARLPVEAARWSGDYRVEFTRDGSALETLSGPIAELFADDVDHVVRAFRDDELQPAEEAEYTLAVAGPDGATIGLTRARIRGVEKLAPPACRARLAGVVIEAIDGVERVDLRIVRGTGALEINGVRLPQQLDLAEGERVEVQVRRSVSGDPMRWSEPTDIEALARPPEPRGLQVEVTAEGPLVSWEPVALPGVEYCVRAVSDGTLLYRGVEPSFVDVSSGGARGYVVSSVRNGLESGRMATGASGTAERRELVPIVRARRVRGLLSAQDHLVQCVRIGRTNVAELSGPAWRRLVVVVTGSDDDALDAAVARLHAPAWLESRSVVAAQVVFGRRVLVAWRGAPGPVRVVEAALELERPDWRMVATRVEPVRGALVGALAGGPRSLRMWSPGSELRLSAADAAVVYREDGSEVRAPLLSASGSPLTALTREGEDVTLGNNVAGAVGLGLSVADTPAVLVACPAEVDAAVLRTLVWADAARGFPQLLAQRLESAWRAPVASAHTGPVSVFHFLRQGRHIEVTLGCEVASESGRSRLHVEVASELGRFARTVRLHLGRPRSYPRVVARVSRWVDRALDDCGGPEDPLALIA